MKKTVFIYLFIISLFIPLLTSSAYAEDIDPAEDWDSVISRFLSENKCLNDSVALGYYNTVTGEEHYYRGDEYMETGSTYKVPLNMVYAERIYNGEMDFDTPIWGIEYEHLQRATIVNSNNDYATILWKNLGEYEDFRDSIADYMGVDLKTVKPEYYLNRLFTAQQVVHCLRTLYSEPERFPGVIDCMLLAEQDNYFCFHPQDYPVAHKYGYIFEDGCLSICDSGICYTDDPIILVMFTANVRHPNSLLAEYCTLMCEYAERTRLLRLSLEDENSNGSISAIEKVSISPNPTTATSADLTLSDQPDNKENDSLMLFIIICIIGLTVLSAVIISAVRGRIKYFSGFLSAVFAILALAFCLTGTNKGTLFTSTEGDPRDSVRGFLDDIISGNYSSACNFLADYSDIGLDIIPDDEASAELIDALRKSYNYELIGDCARDGLSARQIVSIRYLDFSKMSSALQQNTNECIREMVEHHSKNEIYDVSGKYLDGFVSEAYAEAVSITLSHKEDFYSSALVEMDLVYRNDGWLIHASPELFSALCGGT